MTTDPITHPTSSQSFRCQGVAWPLSQVTALQ
jgi:hypothetical protein